MAYETKFHRDGGVTVWNVYTQTWQRRSAESIFSDDRIMATLNAHERARIEAISNGMTLTQARRLARKIYAAADDGGMIQAEDMLRLTSDPRLHTTISMERAARELGCYYSLPYLP